jgi:uncharacterized protein
MAAHLDRSHVALSSAKALLDLGDFVGAANRAYYAVFYAARAAVEATSSIDPVEEIKTHHGLRRVFELYVVKPGRIDKSVASRFNDIEATRIVADYRAAPLPRAEVEAAIQDAEIFVQACEKLFRKPSP